MKAAQHGGFQQGRSVLVRSAAVLAVAALVAGACGSSSKKSSSNTTTGNNSSALPHIGGSVSMWAEWTSTEQGAFEAVLQPFENETGITVNYSGKGSNMDTVLDAAVAGGAPPDVAAVPDPGTLKTLAQKGSLQNIAPVIGNLSSDYGSAWNQLATVNGTLYGVWFKAANKNTIWYNPALFKQAGITSPPTTWEQLITDAGTLKAAGITPFSLCTDVGWPVADLWQNVYLKTAGASNYNSLATHSIKWASPTVTTAFTTAAQLVGQPSYLLGGTQGALASTYPMCADKVFPKPPALPEAAMVIEADFVVSEITGNSSNYTAGTTGSGGAACTADASKTPCYDFFAFPPPAADAANSTQIQGAGDVVMLMHSTPQANELVKYLASPQSQEIWAHLGGYASPNKAVPVSTYPDSVSQSDAQALTGATSFVFSLDDLQGSWEKDMWQDMLNFVKNPSPSNVSTIQATMDQQATAALGH